MSTATVVLSDKDKQRSMYMGPDGQVQALFWERIRLDKVSENVRQAAPLAGEQREAGEARDDLFETGAEPQCLAGDLRWQCLAGDLRWDVFLGDVTAESVDWSDNTKSPSDVSP